MATTEEIARALKETGFPVRVASLNGDGAGLAVDAYPEADMVLVSWESGRRAWTDPQDIKLAD